MKVLIDVSEEQLNSLVKGKAVNVLGTERDTLLENLGSTPKVVEMVL